MRLDRVQIRNNRAYDGGGLWLGSGASTWRRVVIAGNQAEHQGGGLLVHGYPPATASIDTDSGSGITDNLALDGGGLATTGQITLALRGPVAATPGNLLHIQRNVANRGGGAWGDTGTELSLSRVRIERNEAAIGGAVGAVTRLRIADAELRNNTANLRGGAIYSLATTLDLQRLSLNGNQAIYGGGIYGENGNSLLLSNVSVHDNRAQEGAGLFLQALVGAGTLQNLSMLGNVATIGNGSDGLLLIGSALQLAANWMGDGCLLSNASVISLGGNAQRAGTSSCNLQPTDIGSLTAAEASVSHAWYGGRFDIIGFATGNSALEDRATSSICAADDARAYLRTQRTCDIGAYEAAGVAP
jgi:predicted outer membrane repeat protein